MRMAAPSELKLFETRTIDPGKNIIRKTTQISLPMINSTARALLFFIKLMTISTDTWASALTVRAEPINVR